MEPRLYPCRSPVRQTQCKALDHPTRYPSQPLAVEGCFFDCFFIRVAQTTPFVLMSCHSAAGTGTFVALATGVLNNTGTGFARNKMTGTITTASWVIKALVGGQIICETWDRKKVDALDKTRFLAVPIQEHLASLSKKTADEAQKQVPDVAHQNFVVVTFESRWEEGVVPTAAKLDLETGAVFDIQKSEDGAEHEHLIGEFVIVADRAVAVELGPDDFYRIDAPTLASIKVDVEQSLKG